MVTTERDIGREGEFEKRGLTGGVKTRERGFIEDRRGAIRLARG